MVAGLARNPRKVKRTLNTFRLLHLLQAGQPEHRPALLAKLVVLQSSYGDIYEQLVGAPLRLKLFEAEARGQAHAEGGALKELIAARPRLKRMLGMQPFFTGTLPDEEIEALVFQTLSTHEQPAPS